MVVLSTILLGFRATWKEDLQAATAEMIYGASLRLPGEFLCPSKQNADPTTFVGEFKASISSNDSTSRTKYNFREQEFDHIQPYFSALEAWIRDFCERRSTEAYQSSQRVGGHPSWSAQEVKGVLSTKCSLRYRTRKFYRRFKQQETITRSGSRVRFNPKYS
ncbi:hypothetical protein NPIL_557431 [Nephila pilipes]|uniref:Uncharacterized protein n=1 Tax=Nephila pilipes TaxID=299642 RepID=A0A8X6NTF8_NEPPI|nr:hypothetical protein NPIL_266451 [Nephila pilipes]GFT72290.1 hypothetical protein NPIL_557431 [Nephila pilipes]